VRAGAVVAGATAILLLGLRFGFLRAAVAVAMSVAIMYLGIRYMRSTVTLLPEPEVADVGEFGLKYVCTMCGLELKVERAARDRPPTHCGEPMVLVREGGRPPLRPV
jgi:hypothetical protein